MCVCVCVCVCGRGRGDTGCCTAVEPGPQTEVPTGQGREGMEGEGEIHVTSNSY